jgi:hypothetical protein
LKLPVLDVDQNLDIHPEYAPLYAHAGLAAVVDNARTPSFGLCIALLRESLLVWESGDLGRLNRVRRDCVSLRRVEKE